MIAIPSLAIDVYNDFFAKHDLTYFCQISPLKRIMHCPYQDPLSVVMKNKYQLGYFNASLFATEGIASVGTLFAPITVFICGLAIALGNRLSAGLPPAFVLISSAILPQVLLNVPLTTVLLTHGAGLLFLLWYVTPRAFSNHIPIHKQLPLPERRGNTAPANAPTFPLDRTKPMDRLAPSLYVRCRARTACDGIFEAMNTAPSYAKVRSESGNPIQLSDLAPRRV